MRFELDPVLFEDASPARQREWRLAVSDLNGVSPIPGLATPTRENEPTLTVGRLHKGGISIQIEMPDADTHTVKISVSRLRRHFRAYRKVIDQLVRSTSVFSGTDELADLDYAKKQAHNNAADAIRAALADVIDVEHAQARRLFTLIFLTSSALPESLVTRHRLLS